MSHITARDVQNLKRVMKRHAIQPKRVETQAQAEALSARYASHGLTRVWAVGDEYYEMHTLRSTLVTPA